MPNYKAKLHFVAYLRQDNIFQFKINVHSKASDDAYLNCFPLNFLSWRDGRFVRR